MYMHFAVRNLGVPFQKPEENITLIELHAAVQLSRFCGIFPRIIWECKQIPIGNWYNVFGNITYHTGLSLSFPSQADNPIQ